MDIGGVFAVDVSRDLGFCGHVYSIMTLDEDNSVAEPIDLEEEHQSVRETVILCEDGEIFIYVFLPTGIREDAGSTVFIGVCLLMVGWGGVSQVRLSVG